MASLIKLRRDTAANWTQVNPTLASGEPGLETDTRRIKYGDGSTSWNTLNYAGASGTATVGVASTSESGTVKVDGETITINSGVISARQLAGGGTGSGTVAVGTAGSLAYYTNSTNAVDDAAGLTWDNVNSIFSVAGTTVLQQTVEAFNTKTAATGIMTHDFLTGAIWYHSNVTSGFTANFTNIPTANGKVIVVTLIITQGATAYVPSAIQINGVAQTVNWLNTSAPAGNASKIDVISYTLLRVNSSWIATGSLSTYG